MLARLDLGLLSLLILSIFVSLAVAFHHIDPLQIAASCSA